MSNQSKPARKQRVPVSGGERNVLTVRGKEEGFEYRWVNHDPDRIQRFLDAAWEPVTQDVTVGDRKVDSSSGTSSVVERGVGAGKKALLMRVPKEFYDEDQKAKAVKLDEIETAMKQNALKDRYGKLEVSRGPLSQGA